MSQKKKKQKAEELAEEIVQTYDNPQENLLGVFSILLDVAKRTKPEKYLEGYVKDYD